MHNFLVMSIPADVLSGSFDKKTVESYVSKKLKKYTNKKFDYFQIGGRWEGMLASPKNIDTVLLTTNGLFEESYDFFNTYDFLQNNGQRGPYVIDEAEYVPVNGGLVKSIAWDAFDRFETVADFLVLKHVWERDIRLGEIPDMYKFKDDGLYIETDTGELFFAYKEGETFTEYIQRHEFSFLRKLPSPFAYVDFNGVWHDEDDIWDNMDKFLSQAQDEPEDLMNFAQEEYHKAFSAFLDELAPEDGVVIVDYHT